MSEPIDITVNGRAAVSNANPNTPLLYVLRNDLNLKGTRFGCGTGHCGACTVLVDGRPVQSCDQPLWSVANRRVTTVEGLGIKGADHPVRTAFLECQAAQCGYCINGILMEAAGLLDREARPSESEMLEALDRHLCRCGTHVRILRAVRLALARNQKWQ